MDWPDGKYHSIFQVIPKSDFKQTAHLSNTTAVTERHINNVALCINVWVLCNMVLCLRACVRVYVCVCVRQGS